MDEDDDLAARLKGMLSEEDHLRIDAQAKTSKYFATGRDAQLKTHFDALVRRAAHPHGRQAADMRALLLVGGTGAGKTTALNRLFRAKFEDFGKPGCPLISVTMPTPATLKLCGHVILKALDYELARDLKENLVWHLVMKRLELKKTKFLHIDEMQHVTRGANRIEQPKILDTIKSILDIAKVGLVMSGLPELATFLESDAQVKRRTLCVAFGPLEGAGKRGLAIRAIEDLAMTMNLKVQDINDVAARALHAAGGQLGQFVNAVQLAIEEAVVARDGVLTLAHFAYVYARDTGNVSPSRNPFLADQWQTVDVRRILDGTSDNDIEMDLRRKRVVRRTPKVIE